MDEEDDAFVLRAAEMFFRPQRLTINDGALLLADEETVDGAKVDAHASPLVAMFGEQAAKDLDVLLGDNAEGYKARSDAFDMVLDFGMGKPARDAPRAGDRGLAPSSLGGRCRRDRRSRGP